MFEFYTIAIIGILGAMSPGPDFIIVSKNAITHTRPAAYLTAAGIATGILVHSTYCIFGLAIIILHSLLLFNIIRYLGALYLIYLGLKSILIKRKDVAQWQHPVVTLSKGHAFRQGFLINILNPKCILFILAIFTTIVKPQTSYWLQILYGMELSLITLFWFGFIVLILTHRSVRRQIIKIQMIATKVMGLFLVAFALDLIFVLYK